MTLQEFVPSPGMGIVGYGHDITGKIQNFTNGGTATHGCIIPYPAGSKQDIPIVFTAEYNGVINMLWSEFIKDPKYGLKVVELKGAWKEEIDYSLDKCIKEYLDDPYAYLSWPWFGWAAIWNRGVNPIGKKWELDWMYYDVNAEHNWFTKNCFCTEQVYSYYWWLSDLHPERWGSLRRGLGPFYADTYQPVEWDKLSSDEDLFRVVLTRSKEGVVTFY